MLREKFRLYLITDDKGRSLQELTRIVEAALRGGVTAVQLREKHASVTQLFRMVEFIAPLCRQYGALFLLNAVLWHPELPYNLVDGLHVQASTWYPQPRSGIVEWLSSKGQAALVYSAHSVEEMTRLISTGVGAMTLSPIFSTPSKEGILAPLGTEALREARSRLPHATIIALGGIAPANVGDVIRAGADGVAVIRAILDDPDPEAAARRLRYEVDSALAAHRG